MAVLLTFTDLAMSDWFGWILVVALFAVMTVATGGEVTAFQTNTARHTARQLEQLHVETTFASMTVAIAGCIEG